ncbi:hypothetical protein X943_002066 [Babesia divergens]|uniref:Uncharacterized protein n=1 Tax=Babesia divergens TaxID=32595 RepID=A0AAD9G747_BABDI|nr:hypothetical protein X943_002066 [Babesia divergens]
MKYLGAMSMLFIAVSVSGVVDDSKNEVSEEYETAQINSRGGKAPEENIIPNNRYKDALNEIKDTLFMAEGLLWFNVPREEYIDKGAIEPLIEVHDDGSIGGDESIYHSIGRRITYQISCFDKIKEDVLTLLQNAGDSGGEQTVILTETMEQDIGALKGVVKRLDSFIDLLFANSDVNIQLQLLKPLSMDMMNNRNINYLIKLLTDVYVENMKREDDRDANKSTSERIKDIYDGYNSYEAVIKKNHEELRKHSNRIQHIRVPPFNAHQHEMVLAKHHRKYKECIALWYKLYRVLREESSFLSGFRPFMDAFVKTLDDENTAPETLRIYGKAIRVIRNAMMYHIKYYRERIHAVQQLNKLDICISELEHLTVNDRPGSPLPHNHIVEPLSNLPSAYVEAKLSVDYLLREFSDFNTINEKMHDWIRGVNLNQVARDHNNTQVSEAIQKVNMLSNEIDSMIVLADKNRRRLDALLSQKRRDMDSSEEGGETPNWKKYMGITNSLYMDLTSLRLIIMELYDALNSLGQWLPGNLQIFEEYDLMEEIRRLVTLAADSLDKNLDRYTKYTSDMKATVAAMDYSANLNNIIRGQENVRINNRVQSLALKVGEAEFMLSQLNIADESKGALAELMDDIMALDTTDDPKRTATVVKKFFGLRPTVHKALMLAESMTIVKMMESRLGEEQDVLEEIAGEMVNDMVLESLPEGEKISGGDGSGVPCGETCNDVACPYHSTIDGTEPETEAASRSILGAIWNYCCDNLVKGYSADAGPGIFPGAADALPDPEPIAKNLKQIATVRITDNETYYKMILRLPMSFLKEYLDSITNQFTHDSYLMNLATRLKDSILQVANTAMQSAKVDSTYECDIVQNNFDDSIMIKLASKLRTMMDDQVIPDDADSFVKEHREFILLHETYLRSATEAYNGLMDFYEPAGSIVGKSMSAAQITYRRRVLIAEAIREPLKLLYHDWTYVYNRIKGILDKEAYFRRLFDPAMKTSAEYARQYKERVNPIVRVSQLNVKNINIKLSALRILIDGIDKLLITGNVDMKAINKLFGYPSTMGEEDIDNIILEFSGSSTLMENVTGLEIFFNSISKVLESYSDRTIYTDGAKTIGSSRYIWQISVGMQSAIAIFIWLLL